MAKPKVAQTTGATGKTVARRAAKRRDGAPEAGVAPLVPAGALAVALLGFAEVARPLVHVARDGRRLEAVAAILRALAPERTVAVYPEWDCLPFDRASPSRGVMGARAGVLRWLTDRASLPDFVLTTAPALLQRVPPPEVWASAHVEIRVGDRLDPDALIAELRRMGYGVDDRVDEPGEVAVRGRTIDVFPAAAPLPCRIEHEGGRVAAIRSYDPVSQRSRVETGRLVIDPASEIVSAPGTEDLPEPFTGREHGLARFYPRLAAVLDAVPEARLVVEAGTEERVEAFFEQLAEAREGAEAADSSLYLTREDGAALLADRLATASEGGAADGVTDGVAMPAFARERRPAAAFARALRARLKAGDRIVLAGPKGPLRRLVREAAGLGHGHVRLIDAWSEVAAAEPGAMLAIEAPVEAGFRVPEAGASVIAAADLFGGTAAGDVRRAAAPPIGEVELRVGDVAIDRDHGLCVFEGLETIPGEESGEETEEDALRLRFADDAVLMVPAAQADRVWRYGSEADAVTLDRLDGGTWPRRRLEAEAALAKAARAMLKAAEARRRARAPEIAAPAREMERFAAGFGFVRPRGPADRLPCPRDRAPQRRPPGDRGGFPPRKGGADPAGLGRARAARRARREARRQRRPG